MKLLNYIIIVLLSCSACLAISTVVLNSFASGELSPRGEGRVDLTKYFSGCRELENFVVLSQGAVTKRPGTKYVSQSARERKEIETGALDRVLLRCDIGFLSMPHTPIPKNLTAGESSVYEGGGVASFPCENHGFIAGQTVEFYGTAKYESTGYLVDASSTTDRVCVTNPSSPFTESFSPETYDGTETVVRREVVTGGVFCAAGDTSGNIFVGTQNAVATPTCLKKYSWDWTAQPNAFFTPVGGWRGTGDIARSIRLSNDEAFLYLHVFCSNWTQRIYKLTVSDGTGVWTTQPTGGGNNYSYSMDIDTNEYIYVPRSDGTNLQRYSPSDGSLDFTYTGVKGNTACCVNNTMGMVFTGGTSFSEDWPAYNNIYASTIDSLSVVKANLSGNVSGKVIWCIFPKGNFVYVIGHSANSGIGGALANIWKLDNTLTVIASAYIAGAMWGAIDLNGNIIVTLNSSGAADDYQYYVYDDNLVYLTKYKVEGMQVTITPQLNRGDSYTYPCKTNGYGTVEVEVIEAKTNDSNDNVRIIPFIYSAGDSYIMEFGDRYVGFYRTGGQVSE